MAAPLTPSASDNTRGSVGSTSNRAAGANRIGKCPASSSLGQMTSDVFLCQGARVAGSCCATTPTAQYEYSSNSELRTLLTAHCSLRQRHHVPFTERATTGLPLRSATGLTRRMLIGLGRPLPRILRFVRDSVSVCRPRRILGPVEKVSHLNRWSPASSRVHLVVRHVPTPL